MVRCLTKCDSESIQRRKSSFRQGVKCSGEGGVERFRNEIATRPPDQWLMIDLQWMAHQHMIEACCNTVEE